LQANIGLRTPETRPTPGLIRWLETRRSWNTLLIVGVAVVAAVIRFWNFGSLGLSHWDEAYFLTDAHTVSRVWPKGFGQIGWVTAPLVAYTDGTLFHFLGINDWMPIAVSATYGTLSAIALYFLGSRLFGNAVGLIAAAILATAEFSVMFSRMALADATFDFWLITCVLFLWLGFERKRIGYYVLAGISSGVLLNTKYNGIFPLVLAGSWLVGELLLDVIRRPQDRRALLSEYRLRIVGTVVMFGLATALFLPFVLKVAKYPGWGFVFTYDASFGPHTLIKTSPKFILWYYWLFTSPPTVLVSVVGIAVGVVRFTRADRLMLIYTAGMFIAVMLFAPYPREALSLLPAVAIWAGRAIVEVWRVIRTSQPRLPIAAAGASAACLSAILLGQLVPLPHMLSLRTQGYADAGAIATRYQSTGTSIFVRTQEIALLYLKGQFPLRATPSVERLLNEKASSVVFMTDETLRWFPELQAFFDLNRDRLLVVDRVPNPVYAEVLLQPATEDGLSHLDDPPDADRYITFWRVTGPLLYPASWPTL
jgi:4-amino-4-deoxy-L-arabinose transferase-like glycosyltransferase